MSTETPEGPYVGQPATIHLYTDSVAAVVTKVNPKSIIVCSVPVIEGSRRRVNDEAEPFPCWAEDGDVDAPADKRGTPERFTIVQTERGTRYGVGSIRVTLGRSVSKVDHRY